MQNKQQLIDHAKVTIGLLSSDSLTAELLHIALERLTAPDPVPVAEVYQPDNKFIGAAMGVNVRIFTGVKTGTKLYASPVVLADVLPGEWTLRAESNLEAGVATGWDNYRAEMLRRITLIESGQWKLVPVEPTEEMLRASYRDSAVYSPISYRAMLAAAPEFE